MLLTLRPLSGPLSTEGFFMLKFRRVTFILFFVTPYTTLTSCSSLLVRVSSCRRIKRSSRLFIVDVLSPRQAHSDVRSFRPTQVSQ